MSRSDRRGFKAAFGFSVALAALACLIAFGAFLHASYTRAAATDPNPNGLEASEKSAFPLVDWAYWQGVNPDVVAWLTVPDTDIDMPIVQAPRDDPTYYLKHDVHGNANHMGCAYLDAACEGEGFDAPAAYLFGHNIEYMQAMFGALANYSDPDFAERHRTLLLQTPDEKRIYRFEGAAVVRGSDRTKRTAFASDEDRAAWYAERLGECAVASEHAKAAGLGADRHLAVFVTCSYGPWAGNERTLVYATCAANGANAEGA